MTAPSDTHRRAAVRGRESVARWRINSGVWAARLFAVLFGVMSVLPLFQREGANWVGTAILALIAIGILVAGELLRRGSRIAAILLFVSFLAAKLGAWLVGGEPIYAGALWTLIIAGALANGVWGAFALESARRDAALIPPAPPRQSGQPAV